MAPPRIDPVTRYWKKVQVKGPDECWPWTGSKNQKGYGCFKWDDVQSNAHRFAWILRNGPIPLGLHCLHTCDTPGCQNPNHLFLGTNLDNIADKMRKHRHRGAWGERSGSAKLTADEVLQIRARRGDPHQKLADEFGVHKKQIQSIIYRVTWKHLPDRLTQSGAGK